MGLTRLGQMYAPNCRPAGRMKQLFAAARANDSPAVDRRVERLLSSSAVPALAELLKRTVEESIVNGKVDTPVVARTVFDKLVGVREVRTLTQALEEGVRVDALARLLTEAIEAGSRRDGRIDYLDVSAHIIEELGRHQL